ncbi:MAG: archease [Nanoarchaeota archaeon]
MGTYRVIPHTADIRLKVEGDTLRELFAAALDGMNEITKRNFCQNVKEFTLKHSISLSSLDKTSLLIDFLSEVLYYINKDRAIFCKVEFKKLADTNLKASILGSQVDAFDEDIKAVTYHEVEIKKNSKGNYETKIVFDV